MKIENVSDLVEFYKLNGHCNSFVFYEDMEKHGIDISKLDINDNIDNVIKIASLNFYCIILIQNNKIRGFCDGFEVFNGIIGKIFINDSWNLNKIKREFIGTLYEQSSGLFYLN